MLNIACRRPGGDRVRWVEGDARSVRLGRSFRQVVMTGHAFQVFLSQEDRVSALETAMAHLAADGMFVFDRRNPVLNEWREWTPARSRRRLTHPRLGEVAAWNEVAQDPATGAVAYGTFYRVEATGELLSARSVIACPDRGDIEQSIRDAGLDALRWMGDWRGADWTPASPEIVVICRRA